MKKSTKEFLIKIRTGILIFILGCTVLFFLFLLNTFSIDVTFERGYKQGQIDALNGIQHYDRIIQNDTIYIKIK